MTLNDFYTCWRSRGQNPLCAVRSSGRVQTGHYVFLLIFAAVIYMYFSRFGIGETQVTRYFILLSLIWPALCSFYFFFFSGRFFRDQFLQDVHLTALSHKEVLFGASFHRLRVLLIVSIQVLLVTVPMLDWRNVGMEQSVQLASYYLLAWTAMAIGTVIVWREWINQPGRVVSVMIVSYIWCVLVLFASIVILITGSFVLAITVPSSFRVNAVYHPYYFLLAGACCFILVNRIRESLMVAEHALFRHATPDHWPDAVWSARDKRPPRLSPTDRALVRRAFVNGVKASALVFAALFVASLPFLLTEQQMPTNPGGMTETSSEQDPIVWNPRRAFLNGFASIQASLVLSVFTAILAMRMNVRAVGEGPAPSIPGWRRGTLVVYTAAAMLPVTIHTVVCLMADISDTWSFTVDGVIGWIILQALVFLFLNTVNASLLSGVNRRGRALLWMLLAVGSWGFSFTDETFSTRPNFYFPPFAHQYYLGLVLAFAIAAHGLVSWVPRLMQEWWLVERAVERNSGESDQPSIATAGGAFP